MQQILRCLPQRDRKKGLVEYKPIQMPYYVNCISFSEQASIFLYLKALLVSGKVNVNEKDSSGLSPLHYAAVTDDGPCAEVLVRSFK